MPLTVHSTLVLLVATLLVALTTDAYWPPAVGVPLIWPLVALMLSPGGSPLAL